MLESDLRVLFERQAEAEPPPSPISVPAARRVGQSRLRLRRTGTFASPVLAAGAVLAIALTATIGSGPVGPAVAPGRAQLAAPRRFNVLVPYAAFGWLPYRNSPLIGWTWPTAFRLMATRGRSEQWTNLMIYGAGQCTLTVTRLSCGSAEADTNAVAVLGGRAPDVNGNAAFWVRTAAGVVTGDIPTGGKMLAFRYARQGWAILQCYGAANALRIAANVRYGRTSRLRFAARLTALPPAWRTIQQIQFVANGTPPAAVEVLLGRNPSPWATPLPGTLSVAMLSLAALTGLKIHPACSQPKFFPVLNGYRVYLDLGLEGSPPVSTLTAPDADGLYLNLAIAGVAQPMTPSEVFAHHLRLFGANRANWTTEPIAP
jgi:hypothetical protein